jgi:outer membrane autotransporter protein
VSGTPTTAGAFNYTIKVTDSTTPTAQTATTTTVSGTIGGVSLDSQHLRQMQILVTQLSAQISGEAISEAIDNAIQDGFSDNVQAVTPNGSGFTFNFAADEPTDPRAASSDDGVKNFIAAPDRKTSQLVDDEFAVLGYAKAITKAPPKPTTLPREWLAWLDVRGMSISNNSAGEDLRGNQVNVTGGVTRKLTPDFVIGVLGGYEHLDFNSDALNSRLKGDGWTVGTYLGWRLTQTLRFDMAMARTGISYNDTSGAASATIPGSRWLASGGLTGTYHVQAWVLQPSARIYALWEHDSSYTDSLSTVQGENNFSTGRASTGAKLSYPFAWTPTIALAPYVGAYGDYYLNSTYAAVAGIATPSLLLQGWSTRFTSGVAMKFKDGGMISAGGELGGIGSNTNTKVYTYRVQGSVPF